MQKGHPLLHLVCLASACVVFGCASSDPAPAAAPKGRGSAVCNKWQAALSGWVQKCNPTTAAQYETQTLGVVCISDQMAQQCADAVAAAACTGMPAGCDSVSMADPVAAQASCQQYLDAVCAVNVRCNASTTLAQCQQTLGAQVDCTTVFSVTLAFEQCTAELKSLACTVSSLPASCDGVLIKRP